MNATLAVLTFTVALLALALMAAFAIRDGLAAAASALPL